jgi:hypothetical protein
LVDPVDLRLALLSAAMLGFSATGWTTTTSPQLRTSAVRSTKHETPCVTVCFVFMACGTRRRLAILLARRNEFHLSGGRDPRTGGEDSNPDSAVPDGGKSEGSERGIVGAVDVHPGLLMNTLMCASAAGLFSTTLARPNALRALTLATSAHSIAVGYGFPGGIGCETAFVEG